MNCRLRRPNQERDLSLRVRFDLLVHALFRRQPSSTGRRFRKYTATALLRLADSSILPFEFGHFATTVRSYLDDIQKEAQRSGRKLDFSGLINSSTR